MRLLYKFPSRSRPTKFFACLDNILSLAQHDDFVIVPTLDDNDYTIDAPFRQKLAGYGEKVQPAFGRSTSKIHAVNRGMPTGNWDIVIATSDDMEFLEPGFDLRIIADMTLFFPDTDGVLHYPDGWEHGAILSLPVIGRKYYDRFGYIYHPSYQSLFCDEEAVIVADALGKLASIEAGFFRHNHPQAGRGQMDAQYKYTEGFHAVDKRTFESRKRRNFFVKA
jgi:hypothetical protein